jgi:Undecaprenyl-phosphate galactose phosphotransferase WbaP
VAGSPQWTRTLRVALLVVVDGLAVVAATVAAYYLWALPVRNQRPDIYVQLLALLPVFFFANAFWRLYPGFGAGAVETLRRLSLSSSSIFFSLAAISFALKVEPVYSRMTFAIAWLLTLVLVPLARFGLLSWAQSWSWWGERCVVVGTGDLARRTLEALRDALSLGYRPVAVLRTDDEEVAELDGVPVVGGLDCLPDLAAGGLRVLLVADTALAQRNDAIDALRHDFRHLILIRDHRALPVDGLEVRNLGGVIGVEFFNQLQRRRNRVLKRLLDLGLGSLFLILSAPLWLGAALLIRLTSRGSPFYTQEREGLFGRRFRLIKLRTMFVDAEARLERHLAADAEARAQWEAHRKLRHDPRILALGRWLRRFSIDELPQLWHVVRGDMSLVGPRPFPEYHLEAFSPAFRQLRRRVRPGLTGLWQVMVRSEGGIAEQEAHDSYYIRNWSLWMDLYVLGKTFAAVIRGRGAY